MIFHLIVPLRQAMGLTNRCMFSFVAPPLCGLSAAIPHAVWVLKRVGTLRQITFKEKIIVFWIKKRFILAVFNQTKNPKL